MAGKPIHPATIHFPISFLTLSFSLDILNYSTPNLPASITTLLPPTLDLHRASYYLLALGVFSAIPAILSGATQALQVFSKGLYESDNKTIRPKVKLILAHAALSDITVLAAGYIWYLRRAAIGDSLAEKVAGIATEQAWRPEDWMVGVEALLTGVFMYALNLGGMLTYNYGVGFSALGSSKKKV